MVRLIRPNEYDPETDSGDGFQFTYDAQGRVLTVLSPDGHVLQSNTYDADGRLLQRLDGVGSGVKYEYDLAGAQRRIVSMGGASQELEYDARGRITGIVDGNGSETKYLLDEWGRITGVVKADGSTERYAYNFAGDMVSSTDGEGHTTQYEYNRMGKISAIVDPTGERETYHYDGQGRLIRKTDRNGVTVELGYNLYGAPLFKKEKDGAQGDFYEYTPEGLLKCAISAGMRYAYEYDEMGRMTRKSASGRTLLALEYDRNGNKVRQVDVTGKLTGFDYDPLGQLTRLTDDGQELAAYTYNPDGTPRAVAHGPIRQEYAYDLDKNLTGSPSAPGRPCSPMPAMPMMETATESENRPWTGRPCTSTMPSISSSGWTTQPILRSCSTTGQATAPGVWWAARRNCTSTTPATA
ncbi:hypothetical protein [Flavonifractor plautii]|uniref:hypothetical protein n=1 Tax=Flavonifractor plautii TaxID=292800 RepID=UPI0022E14CDE|nr:hypothetical protein [Flavonifractor plautii]